MLAVILKILSILGIILLVLLGIVILLLLVVLFLPIVYRIRAEKTPDQLWAKAKIRWLFGLVRADYAYPEPGSFVVKVLWFTLYDSAKTSKPKTAETVPQKKEASVEEPTAPAMVPDAVETKTTENSETKPEESAEQEIKQNPDVEDEKKSIFEKIRYTIKQIYDKIKHIIDNITFYKKLLQDEDTKLLVSHAWKRLCKIFRSIRPRRLKADVLFGMDSPDTTGYLFAVYGMLSPHLGKHVQVTPDFTQAILEGRVNAAGHIMIFTLLLNVLAVLFDKRLQLLKRRLDAHKKKMQKEKE